MTQAVKGNGLVNYNFAFQLLMKQRINSYLCENEVRIIDSALRNTGSKRKLYLHLSTVLGALDLGYYLEVRAFYLFSQVEVPLMSLKLYHFISFNISPLSKLNFLQ